LLTAASPINVERFPLMLALERLERSLGLPSGRGGRRGRARHQQPAMLVWAPGVGGTNARIVRLVRGETKVDGGLGVATGGRQPVSEQEWRRRGRGRARAVGHRGGWGGASRSLPAARDGSCPEPPKLPGETSRGQAGRSSRPRQRASTQSVWHEQSPSRVACRRNPTHQASADRPPSPVAAGPSETRCLTH
jgi:hypothetical protein